jgi:hypothetical protein
VAARSARARAEGVPLWIARRFAPGPLGQLTVAVDRSLVRVDVGGPHAPVLRLRAPYGFRPEAPEASRGPLGDTTGSARFRTERGRPAHGDEPAAADDAWDRPWFSNLGSGRQDNEPGGGDGWGSDGGDGGDSGGGDGGGGGE